MKGNVRKKILKGVLTIIFSLILFSLTMQSNAAEEVTEVDSWDVSNDDGTSNVTATLYSDGSFVISGTGAMKDYSSSSDIPYNDKKSVIKTVKIESGVTSIGEWAFYACTSLTSINVDENNKNYISENGILFNKNKTEIINYPAGKEEVEYIIPNMVTSIGRGAFESCTSLTSIKIPEGVTSIGSSTFKGCTSLTSINIPEGVTSIGDYAFYECTSLTSINIPEGVTSIGDYAFYECTSLTSIEIPEGVTSIGKWAFESCTSLTSIEIPKGVTSIGHDAFYYCISLTSINVNENNKNYSSGNGVLFNKDKTEIISYPAGKEEAEYIIPNMVTSIGKGAFEVCSSLTSIEIPEGVTRIGNNAFRRCTSLTSIEIPEGVTSIGWYAFANCKSLASIEILEGVTSIGRNAFESCTSLTSIEIPEGATSIGGSAFYRCTSLTSIEIPDSVTSIGGSAFYCCTSLTSIEIPEGVTNIGDEAFEYCTNLTSIEIPEGVTSIGNHAFYECRSLTSIEIPDSVTSIGDSAFSGIKLCILIKQNTTQITLPKLIKRAITENDILYSEDISLTNCSFNNDGETLSIDINKIVEGEYAKIEIREGALKGMTIYITNGIWDISENGDGSVIATLTENGLLTISGQGNMKGHPYTEIYNKINIVKIGEGITSIGSSAFESCRSLTRIEIPEGVTSIGNYVFSECTSLTSIEIPEGVTSIGYYAFYKCTSLTSIEIPDSVTNIGLEAFVGCENLTIYYESSSYIKEYAETNNIKYAILAIEKLIIATEPSKKTYVEGQSFNNTGMEIEVKYNSGRIKGLTDYTIKNGDNLQVGQTSVTISYTEDGVTKTAEQKIAVQPKAIIMIIISKGPSKTTYIEGQDFITRGMIVKVRYNDGDIKEITDYTVTNGEDLKVGQTTVTISYTENEVTRTATQIITVTPREILRITITKAPSKTEYIEGETFDKSGMAVIATYSDGNVIEITDYTVTNGTNLQLGQESVTISYTVNGVTKTAEQAITVAEKEILEITLGNYKEVEDQGNSYLESINPNTKISELVNNIQTNGNIEIYKGTTKITNENTILKTGMNIKISLNEQEKNYIVVVTGDLNGDGQIGNIDLLKIARYNAGLDKNLEGAYLRATDIYKDGKYADNKDLLKIARVLAELDNL